MEHTKTARECAAVTVKKTNSCEMKRKQQISHRGVVDVRGCPDFSRFDPRPERSHFSNFGVRPRSEDFLRKQPAGPGAKIGFFVDKLSGVRTLFSRHGAKRPTLAD